MNIYTPRDIDKAFFTVGLYTLDAILGQGGCVTLCSHGPSIKDHEFFNDWVYVAQSVQFMRMDSMFKGKINLLYCWLKKANIKLIFCV